ncbi:MAG: hypothetical protein COY68_03670 [Candidatus Levybacteria bacterium CG_4_10_14_0_8_um_filter_35_23]|nr:MAG: hypothetical protein COY68_03670 [Candidatus Levybacteria bacterium CG_4_10_14_0_8_um_filter_35_23]
MKQRAIYFGKRLIKSDLVSGSFYLFVGSMIGSAIAFILNLYFARSLSAIDYGIYASLLSLLTLGMVPSQSLSPAIVKFAADYFSVNDINSARAFYFKALKFLTICAAVFFIIFLIFSGAIGSFLKINDISVVIILGITIAVTYLTIVNQAYLQSLLKFKFISFNSTFNPVIRAVVGAGLVLLGFRVFGAVSGLLAATICTFILTFFPLQFMFKALKQEGKNISVGKITSFALPAFIAIFSLSSFISMDVILVKHFFSPQDAGLYGGLSLVGKVIFYFTGVVPGVMFPLLIKRHAKGEAFNNLFYLALALVLLPSIAITFFYFLFPSLSINIFLGYRYLSIAPFLGLFGIYITVFSVSNLCVNFFLSLNKTKIYVPVLVASIVQILLIFFFHTSFYQVIGISLITLSALLIVLIVYYLIEFASFEGIVDAVATANNPKD